MARSRDELRPQQAEFLDYLFDDECKGSVTKAAAKAKYHPAYTGQLVASLKEEIIEMAERILAKGAPAAAFTLIDAAAGEGDAFISNARLDAAKQVLDRIGLSRKERLDVRVESTNGIFILPPKAPLD